ncbi:MAG: hypothetical protein ACLGGV_06140 [Bacteroidia bacterium]
MLKRIVTLSLLISLPTIYVAQGFYSRNNWKNRKHEFALGGGVSNAMTDLGGGKGVGMDLKKALTPIDLDHQATSYGFTLEYSYAIARKWNWRTNLVYGRISADDKWTPSYRATRGFHFNSQIFEVSTIFIHHFSKERIGHLYSLRNTRGTKLGVKPLHLGWYVFGGIGGFKFDPKASVRNSNNSWGASGENIRLQPLRTEGQGVAGYSGSPYSLYNVCMPFGFGARHSINGSTGVKIEFGYRFTFTDYLDDTSSKTVLASDLYNHFGGGQQGSLAAYFSDHGSSFAGNQRDQIRGNDGFLEDDGYLFLMLTFYFNRDPRHWFDDARRSAIKVRRPKASF